MTEGVNKKKPKKSPIPGAKQFTSEYQPTKKARQKGQWRRWDYQRSRQQFFEKLCDVEMPDGTRLDFWDKVRQKIHALILDKNSKLEEKEKADLIMKLCKEFMPEDKNINLGNTEGNPFVINFVEETND